MNQTMERPGFDPDDETFVPAVDAQTLMDGADNEAGQEPKGAQPERTAPNRRQQDKLVAVMSRRDVHYLSEAQVTLEPGERESVLRRLADGSIGAGEQDWILGELTTPVSSDAERGALDPRKLEQMFAELAGDTDLREILRMTTDSYGSHAPQPFDAGRVRELATVTPLPSVFEKAALFAINGTAMSSEQRQRYLAALPEFEQKLYGKRYEYWQQLQLMRQEAEAERERSESPTQVVSRRAVEAHEAEEPSGAADPYEAIEPGLGQGILDITEVHANPYKGEKLTAEKLRGMGLEPKYGVEMPGLNMYFSDTYALDDAHIAVMGYMHSPDGEMVARSYYLSNSSGEWRYLPAYAAEGREFWDKGRGEESLGLVPEAQAALSVFSRREPLQLAEADAALAFHGTARHQSEDGTYGREVHVDPVRLNGNLMVDPVADDYRGSLVPPEELRVNDPNQLPDFSMEPRLTWRQQSPVAGLLTMEVYESPDGHTFTMARDEAGGVMVSAVGTRSQLTKAGVREEWVDAGNLTTPLWEYAGRDGGYGDHAQQRGHYVSMRGYLDRTPLIRQYRQQRQAAISSRH